MTSKTRGSGRDRPPAAPAAASDDDMELETLRDHFRERLKHYFASYDGGSGQIPLSRGTLKDEFDLSELEIISLIGIGDLDDSGRSRHVCPAAHVLRELLDGAPRQPACLKRHEVSPPPQRPVQMQPAAQVQASSDTAPPPTATAPPPSTTGIRPRTPDERSAQPRRYDARTVLRCMLSWSVGSSDAGWKALEASSDADGDGTHSESELLVLAKSALPNLDARSCCSRCWTHACRLRQMLYLFRPVSPRPPGVPPPSWGVAEGVWEEARMNI